MTDHARAIEAGERALDEAIRKWQPGAKERLHRVAAKACIEAAIASGALVPASADNTTLATSATNRIAKVVSMSPETRDDVHGIIQETLAGFVNAAIASGALVASAVAEMRDGTIDRVAEAIAARAIERGHPIKPVVVRHVAIAAIEAIRQLDTTPASGDYVVVPRILTDAMKETAAHIADGPWISAQEHWAAMLHAASRTGGGK